MQAAVARSVCRREHRELSLEAVDTGLHEGTPFEHAGVVDQIPRRERVGPVQHDIVVADDAPRVLAREHGLPGLDPHVRIQGFHAGACRLCLGHADAGRVVQDLPLQVVHRDRITVQQSESPDAGGGEIQRCRRAESAQTDDQHRCRTQSLLAVETDVRQYDVARVALEFVRGERHRRNIREGAPRAVGRMMPLQSCAGVIPEPPPLFPVTRDAPLGKRVRTTEYYRCTAIRAASRAADAASNRFTRSSSSRWNNAASP